VCVKLEVLISIEKIQTGICTFPANIENFFLKNCLQSYKNGTACNLVVLTNPMSFTDSWASAEIFPGRGKVDILLIFLWLLTMKRKFRYAKKKMSNVTATVACSAFLVRKLYIEQMFILASMDILRLT